MARDCLACPSADRVRGLGSQQGHVCGQCLAEPRLPFTPDLRVQPSPWGSQAICRGEPSLREWA